ncbi:MAG: TonB-dependent receptor [Bacteroidaceae bacterium]|nr:TonB-dependent receptor [Bacteroidaceae bacterium]
MWISTKAGILSIRRHILILLALTLSCVQTVGAIGRVHIRGRVTDENGNPVELATVNEAGLLATAITNLRGEYRMDLNYQDTITLVFRMIGHENRRRQIIDPEDTVTLNVMLPTNGYSIQGVTVSSSRAQTDQMQEIKGANLRLTPGIGGASVESVIATQAGVSTHSELSNQYNVRGGNFDENSVYVNGIEIMRPQLVRAGQQEGLSFINPDMVESISFSTGGFGVQYGDRMASVLDIKYRTPDAPEASVQAGLLGGSLFAGTGNDRFSIMTSLRYKTTSYILGTLDTDGEYKPSFLDFQTAATWKPAEDWRIGMIGNIADNTYHFTPSTRKTKFGTAQSAREFTVYFEGQEHDRFITTFGALDISHDLNDGGSIALTLSAFNSQEQETSDILGEYWLNHVDGERQMSVGAFRQHIRNYLEINTADASLKGTHRIDSHTLQWGAGIRREKVHDNMREWESLDSAGFMLPTGSATPLTMSYTLHSRTDLKSTRSHAYLQDTWKIMGNPGLFSLNAGVRLSHWSLNGETLVSPRVSVGFIPSWNEDLTFRAATGIYYQSPFFKELKDTVNTGGIATVVPNMKIKSQRSIQIVLGGDYDFKLADRPFRFTAEVYAKKLDNLIPYDVDNVRIIYTGHNSAHGYAVGIDTKLFGEFVPGNDSWITFSLMKTEEKISGKWLPRPSDQRYNVSLYYTDYFPGSDRWQMVLKGNLADGLPFGPSHTGREEAIFRAPAYKRLDIGMSYLLFSRNKPGASYRLSKIFNDIWIGADCLNLFGINNVSSYFWVKDVSGTQYGVPNYMTGRLLNLRILMTFGG